MIKTEGYKKDGSWRSTLANITVPGFSAQRTRRYEPEEDSPEVESPAKAKGKMFSFTGEDKDTVFSTTTCGELTLKYVEAAADTISDEA